MNATTLLERKGAARAKWVQANPEAHALAQAAYREKYREQIRAKARAKYLAECIDRPSTASRVVQTREQLLAKKRVQQKAYIAKYPERIAATRVATYAKHRTARNAEKAAWSRKNTARVLSWTRTRQLAKLQRTPAWLSKDDKWMIEQAYELAALRTRMCGFVWHVDHIIPLQGKKVSGLHVPTNLQVISGAENSRKRNFYEVAYG